MTSIGTLASESRATKLCRSSRGVQSSGCGDPGSLQDAPEPSEDVVPVQLGADLGGEHQAVLLPSVPGTLPRGRLPGALPAQRSNAPGWDGQGPARPPCFGVATVRTERNSSMWVAQRRRCLRPWGRRREGGRAPTPVVALPRSVHHRAGTRRCTTAMAMVATMKLIIATVIGALRSLRRFALMAP
jgi:hypothetical protein